jgi:hypothetical protein
MAQTERIAARIDQLAAYDMGGWSVYQTLLVEGYCEDLDEGQRELLHCMIQDKVIQRQKERRLEKYADEHQRAGF